MEAMRTGCRFIFPTLKGVAGVFVSYTVERLFFNFSCFAKECRSNLHVMHFSYSCF